MIRDGKVAIANIRALESHIKIDGKSYDFNPQHCVSICWVNEEDIDKVLHIMGGCNCTNGSKSPIYMVASDVQIRVYETGAY